MPVNFEAFKEDNTVDKKFDKRTYFARTWREMGGNKGGGAADYDQVGTSTLLAMETGV